MRFLLIKIVVKTNTIEYIYNATGQKVSKIVNEATNITQTNYLAVGFQYKNNVLQFFQHAEGYVKHEANNYSYVFNYTDHLGNVRVSYNDIDGNGRLGCMKICLLFSRNSTSIKMGLGVGGAGLGYWYYHNKTIK